ncbi:hypothetical protein T02_9496 [Trichinella nativa]|uniref:Uncharacterized protein n=1 Tax=Trichinella nativa TaxID=6335 RepID=A0A0V1LKY0_9BILA|nr:hypothetical protein T02_9496 [Trichinella nativa]
MNEMNVVIIATPGFFNIAFSVCCSQARACSNFGAMSRELRKPRIQFDKTSELLSRNMRAEGLRKKQAG